MKWRSIFALFIFANQALFGAQPSQTQTAPSVERHVTFAQTVEGEPAARQVRQPGDPSRKLFKLERELQQMQEKTAQREKETAQLCLKLFEKRFDDLQKSANTLKQANRLNTPQAAAACQKSLQSLSKTVQEWEQEQRHLPYYSFFECEENATAISQEAKELNREIAALIRTLQT